MPSSIVVQIKLRTPEVMAAVQRVCWDAAKQTATAIEQDIKGVGPHNIDVSIRDDRGHYVPSPPGQPPHLRTGNLRRSYHVEFDQGALVARVGSDPAIAPYAVFLELGSRNMEARPHLVPAMQYQVPFVAKRVADGLTTYFKSLGKMQP